MYRRVFWVDIWPAFAQFVFSLSKQMDGLAVCTMASAKSTHGILIQIKIPKIPHVPVHDDDDDDDDDDDEEEEEEEEEQEEEGREGRKGWLMAEDLTPSHRRQLLQWAAACLSIYHHLIFPCSASPCFIPSWTIPGVPPATERCPSIAIGNLHSQAETRSICITKNTALLMAYNGATCS